MIYSDLKMILRSIGIEYYLLLFNTDHLHYSQVCIFKFIYSLKFIFNPKVSTHTAFAFIDMSRAAKILGCPTSTFPTEATQEDILPPCFSSHIEMNREQKWQGECRVVQEGPARGPAGGALNPKSVIGQWGGLRQVTQHF